MKSITHIMFALVLLFVAIAPSRGADADHPDHPAIAVEMAVPQHGNERRINLREPPEHFHVVLRNVSDRPQRIWREWCTWGYFNLTFEITDDKGKKSVAKKRNNKPWTRNYADCVKLEPGEMLVMDVHAGNPEEWEGFPFPENGTRTVTMQAVHEVKPDKEAAEQKAWTGRVVSQASRYTFHHWKPEAK